MKVYNKIVIDMDSSEIVEEDSFEYDGPLAMCFNVSNNKSSGQSYMIDPVAARRMADIAQQQADLGNQQWNYYLRTFQPYETSLAKSNQRLIAPNESLTRKQMQAQESLIPERTRAAGAAYTSAANELEQSQPAVAKFYEQAMNGVNVGDRMRQAGAGVAQQFDSSMGQTTRALSRMGVNPNSASAGDALSRFGIARAKAVGGAMTGAKNLAEAENFQRLNAAVNARQGSFGVASQGTPYNAGNTNQGGYQLTSPAQTAMQQYSSAIDANKAGMGTLYKSSGSGGGWGIF